MKIIIQAQIRSHVYVHLPVPTDGDQSNTPAFRNGVCRKFVKGACGARARRADVRPVESDTKQIARESDNAPRLALAGSGGCAGITARQFTPVQPSFEDISCLWW